MSFWIMIVALALGVAAVLCLALLRGRASHVPASAYDLQVYRDQLKEVDRDLARGVIADAEAERIRTEVSRRLLSADADMRAAAAPTSERTTSSTFVAMGLVGLAVGGAMLLYAQIGAPGYGDLPLDARIAASDQARTDRLSQVEAEARTPPRPPAEDIAPDYLELMERLRETVATRPDDLRGLQLLVRNEASLGNINAAYAAQREVLRIKGPEATANDHALFADLMIASAGGYVSVEAEKALREALQKDPENPTSRYYLGYYLIQVDRPDAAFRMWERLLRESPPDAPWVAPIRAEIEDLAWRAGVQYRLPENRDTVTVGPTDDDLAAAQDLTEEERREMILGMVSRLAARIDTEGGAPEEWARLITAYSVLGEREEAARVWSEAQSAFWDAPQFLDQIRASAIQAGVAE